VTSTPNAETQSSQRESGDGDIVLTLPTERLELVLKTPEELRLMIEGMSPDDRRQVSADWLARVEAAKSADPWVHGFSVLQRSTRTPVGHGAFKAPPENGIVEIAYAIDPDHRGRGYATEVARALVTYAFGFPEVSVVRAHTLPEENASTRVLEKCGLSRVGEVVDPEDGLVWRFQIKRPVVL
jgi:RimJ/RimL family protein N-acetyltransferase